MSAFDDGDDSKESSADVGYVEPDYDISDVRRALKQLYTDLQQQQAQQRTSKALLFTSDEQAETALKSSYAAMLGTLSKVAGNLLKTPPNPAHLALNLRSAAVLTKFAAHNGARALLRFLGFEERLSAEAHSMVVPLENLVQLRTRIERALTVIGKVREENTPPPAEDADMADAIAASLASSSSSAAAATAVAPSSRAAVSSSSSVAAASAVASSAASMEDDDAPLVAAPASVFLANSDDADGSDAVGSPSPSPPDEEMRANLNPAYDVGDVKSALRNLFTQVDVIAAPPAVAASSSSSGAAAPRASPFAQRLRRFTVRESYVSVIDTLAKVTGNLLRTPVNPQHLRINIANATVYKKFAQFAGAREYLAFLGFKESSNAAPAAAAAAGSDAAAAPAATTSPSADGAAQYLVLSESDLNSDQIKLQRALSMLQQARNDALLTEAEQLQQQLGPIDRSLRVFDVNNVSSSSARAHPVLASASEEPSAGDSRGDLALVLAAAAVERKRTADLSRTDIIITKTKQAEIKEAAKRKYHVTLVKVTFSAKSTVQAAQGTGRYGQDSASVAAAAAGRLPGGGYKLGGLKGKYGVPTAAATAAGSSSSTAAPMEDEEEEKKSSTPVALPIAQPVSTAAAATPVSPVPTAAAGAASASASSSAAAPAAPPAPELLLTAFFRPWESMSDVYHWLQSELLVHGFSTDPFYLHMPPAQKFQCGGEDKAGKQRELAGKSLQQLGLVPAASLIFHLCVPAGSAAREVSGAALASLREEVRVCAEAFDVSAIAALMPQAENRADLDQQKAKLIADMRSGGGGAGAASSNAAAAGSASKSTSGGAADDDDDGDVAAYMARKKAAAASKSNAAKPTTAAASTTSSAAAAGAAAKQRNIPGMFKPRGS